MSGSELPKTEFLNSLPICSICLLEIRNRCVKLLDARYNCKHVYHKNCISSWIKWDANAIGANGIASNGQNSTCPYCRATARHIIFCSSNVNDDERILSPMIASMLSLSFLSTLIQDLPASLRKNGELLYAEIYKDRVILETGLEEPFVISDTDESDSDDA